MNVSHVTTKIFTHMNFYKVNIYTTCEIFIHVMLNDICLPCCHLSNKLFQDNAVYSVPDVPISTQIIATVIQKLH